MESALLTKEEYSRIYTCIVDHKPKRKIKYLNSIPSESYILIYGEYEILEFDCSTWRSNIIKLFIVFATMGNKTIIKAVLLQQISNIGLLFLNHLSNYL